MSVYLIGAIDRQDIEAYQEYEAAAFATIADHGIEPLAVDDDPGLIEGGLPGKRIILLKFENREKLDEWYRSEAYQKAKAIRLKAADTRFLIAVEGLP